MKQQQQQQQQRDVEKETDIRPVKTKLLRKTKKSVLWTDEEFIHLVHFLQMVKDRVCNGCRPTLQLYPICVLCMKKQQHSR
jgi:hypothetical protein